MQIKHASPMQRKPAPARGAARQPVAARRRAAAAAASSDGHSGSNGNGASAPPPAPTAGQLLTYLGGSTPPAATLGRVAPQAAADAPAGDAAAAAPAAGAERQGASNGAGAPLAFSTAAMMPVYAPREVFTCPEESSCYSQALEKLVLSGPAAPQQIIEFGAGDGAPVISALLKTPYSGVCTAFELSPAAADVARGRAKQFGLGARYQVRTGCFFEGADKALKALGAGDDGCCLISNPPYLPARDPEQLLMPALYGGADGGELTQRLLSLGFPRAMLIISAFSNPVGVLRHAAAEGYVVEDFAAWPLPFGTYSSQPEVRSWIAEMKDRGEAFYSDAAGMYLIAGVLFRKRADAAGADVDAGAGADDANGGAAGQVPDLTKELLRVLTAL